MEGEQEEKKEGREEMGKKQTQGENISKQTSRGSMAWLFKPTTTG